MPKEDEGSLPAILIGLVVVVAVGIGGFFWVASKRDAQSNLAREAEMQARAVAELRARTARLTLWRDSVKVEDVEKAKLLCEEKVSSIRRKVEPQIPEDKRGISYGKDLYGKAKNLSDSCIDYLLTGIARRFDKPDDYAEISKRMEESDNAMRLFDDWVNAKLIRQESDIRDSNITRTLDYTLERLPRWVNDFKKIEQSDEDLAQFKARLERCRLKSWDEIE
jgi:hypothetical protein